MKIKVSDLKRPLTVTVTGDEEWLDQIYSGFLVPEGKQAPRLKAEVTFTPETASIVDVKASIHFTPYVACSRCLDPLPWKIEREIAAIYRVPPSFQDQKERELASNDLDEYWMESGIIDVEALLNEEVQLAIPSQTVLGDEEGNGCPKCRGHAHAGPLYQAKSAAGEKTENPFAALKNLKLSQ